MKQQTISKSSKNIFARDIYYIDSIDDVITNHTLISDVKKNIERGDLYVIRNVVSKSTLESIREYLIQIGQNSLPNYMKIEGSCPNFHRINNWDSRAHVQACFHQFVFFPWNQDVFNLFELFKKVFQLKNLLSGIPMNKFLGSAPEEGCTARVAFQFYPRGIGGMHKHSDPVDYHQVALPLMNLSTKGIDFKEGGAYIEKENGNKINLDEIAGFGELIYYNALIPHGVLKIDPDEKVNWLSFKGRWMVLFPVNKLFDNENIANAVDLE